MERRPSTTIALTTTTALAIACSSALFGCSSEEDNPDGATGAGASQGASQGATTGSSNGGADATGSGSGGGSATGGGGGGTSPCSSPEGYDPDLSIALPGDGTGMRDVFIDAAGSVYMAGGTNGVSFPVTNGTYVGGPNGRGDILVVKFDPGGALAWSTIIGSVGDGDEYAYALEVSASGEVYIAGRASIGLPTTAGALQAGYQGYVQGSHGANNAFLAKLGSGGEIVTLTYFGTGPNIRDLAIDPATGDVLVASQFNDDQGQSPMPSQWFSGAAQPAFGGAVDGVVARLPGDLSEVVWATYVGGSGIEEGTGSIKIDQAGNILFATNTKSPDLPVTASAFQKTLGGGGDLLLAKYTPAGALVYLTYYGGSGNESTETHNLGVDAGGNGYLIGQTKLSDCPMTAGALQPSHAGAATDTDYVVAKISSDGSQLLGATYLGGPGWEGVGSIAVDAAGFAYVSGASQASFPVSSDAYQAQPKGGSDVVFAVLSPGLDQMIYATYFGGSGNNARGDAIDVNAGGQVAFRFADDSTDLPLINSPWPSFQGPGTAFARFVPQCAR